MLIMSELPSVLPTLASYYASPHGISYDAHTSPIPSRHAVGGYPTTSVDTPPFGSALQRSPFQETPTRPCKRRHGENVLPHYSSSKNRKYTKTGNIPLGEVMLRNLNICFISCPTKLGGHALNLYIMHYPSVFPVHVLMSSISNTSYVAAANTRLL